MSTPESLRQLLRAHVALPAADDAPLELDSFDEVVLIETLEEGLAVTLRAADVAAARPLTVQGLCALVNKTA